MGFDFCATPTEDMIKHQYTAHPVAAGTTIDAAKCEPAYLAPNYSKLAARTTGAPPLVPTASYMGFMAQNPEAGTPGPDIEWLAVAAGAQNLTAASPQARVLCLFSCNTVAAFKPMVQAKGWPVAADSGFVCYTTGTNRIS
jgi:hypothetical protein